MGVSGPPHFKYVQTNKEYPGKSGEIRGSAQQINLQTAKESIFRPWEPGKSGGART